MSSGGIELSPYPTPYPTWGALFRAVFPPIMLPVFLAAADGTIVATALPAIAASLGEVEQLSFVVIANLIAATVAAPAYGRLADMFGRRRLMVVALALYMAASVLCALSRSLPMLVAMRALQGCGGGGLMALSQALLGEHVPVRARGQFQGYLAGCIVAGTTFGPVAGGLLTEAWGWQAVFLLNLPLGALAMLLLSRLPPGVAHSAATGFDLPGMVLLPLFVVPLLLALSRVQTLELASLPGIVLLLALAGAALAALLRQQRRAAAPLLALGLLRHPAFWRADLMAACSGASLTAMVTFLPIYLLVVRGANAAMAGLILVPLTGSISLGSVCTGWLVGRTGRTAIFPGIGLVVTALTMVALAIWAPGLGFTQLAWVLALGGACQGTAMLVAQLTVQLVAGPRQLGAAAASVQLARSLGSAFGVGLAGAVLFGVLTAIDRQTAHLFIAAVRHGPEVLAALGAERLAQVQGQIAAAFRGVFLTVACFSCTILAAAWTMPLRRV
jgi:MFS family permease